MLAVVTVDTVHFVGINSVFGKIKTIGSIYIMLYKNLDYDYFCHVFQVTDFAIVFLETEYYDISRKECNNKC